MYQCPLPTPNIGNVAEPGFRGVAPGRAVIMCPPINKCISHFTHMNDLCHTYKSVVSRIHPYIGTRKSWDNARLSIYACDRSHIWVMSHIWMSHATHMNESCHTNVWVMSNIWMSHATHMNESCRTYEWVMPRTWIHHITNILRTWALRSCPPKNGKIALWLPTNRSIALRIGRR